MNNKLLISFITILGIFSSSQAEADGSPAASPRLYFEIGGGEPVRTPVSVHSLADLGVRDDLSKILSCDLWDIKHGKDLDHYVDMVKRYLEGELDALGQQIVLNIQSFVQGAIVGTLQRAMPGLYDYSQNVHDQLSGQIELAKTSCEKVAKSTRNAVNPMAQWREASDLERWKTVLGVSYTAAGEMEFAGGSVLSGKNDVSKNQGNESVPWFGGKKGGKGEEPIELVNDTVSVGYALLSGQTPDLTEVISDDSVVTSVDPITGDSKTTSNRLGSLWSDSSEATQWAKKVLGEQTISFCQSCDASRQSGAGLLAAYHQEREAISGAWVDLLKAYPSRRPTLDDMKTVSGWGVKYHVEVVDTLMEMNQQDRGVYIDRLAADTALSLTVEKGMALRRMLRVAAQTPTVASYGHVGEELKSLQDEIKTELDELKWELDLQQTVSSNVARSILAYGDSLRLSTSTINRGGAITGVQQTDVVIQNGRPVQIKEIE